MEQLSTMFRANKRANKFHLGHIVKLETQLREKIRSQGKADSTLALRLHVVGVLFVEPRNRVYPAA